MATQTKRIGLDGPSDAPAEEPASERRLAWETLRERDLEEKMGQGGPHGAAVKLAIDATTALCEEQQRRAYIGWDVFVEWDPNDPRARVSPDLFLLDGQEPTMAPSIWRTWEPGCDPPRFALEIVSKRSRTKDYEWNPAKYAALGVEELAVFDAEPRGEEAFAIQLYRRTPRGQFLRAYAGPGPVESKVLGAWLVVVDGGARVRLARNAAGTDFVPTADERAIAATAQAKAAQEQAEAAQKEVQAAQEQAKAAQEQAKAAEQRAKAAEDHAAAFEARVRELEALLRSTRGE
jgi:Uma2 family endonuclease